MKEQHWETLLAVIDGKAVDPLPVGFIVDSPWLPDWAGMTILDYFSSGEKWFEANRKVQEAFPEIMFLPGYWSEYGMCTEPSAFGSRCVWHENEFPFADPVAPTADQAATLARPDPKVHGLGPFVLKRLEKYQGAIGAHGGAVRFAVARGPLNVASFLMGSTEFLMALKLEPDKMHALLETVTGYIEDWLKLQAAAFPTIEGILLLDDIVGFLGEEDGDAFSVPYLKRAFGAIDAKVRFFHNDAQGKVCAPRLEEIGVNLFNFSHKHSLSEMREWTGGKVALLGNIPPRDVLAKGTPEEVSETVRRTIDGVEDRTRLILSCGGGMPPGAPTENIRAFLKSARSAAAVS